MGKGGARLGPALLVRSLSTFARNTEGLAKVWPTCTQCALTARTPRHLPEQAHKGTEDLAVAGRQHPVRQHALLKAAPRCGAAPAPASLCLCDLLCAKEQRLGQLSRQPLQSTAVLIRYVAFPAWLEGCVCLHLASKHAALQPHRACSDEPPCPGSETGGARRRG